MHASSLVLGVGRGGPGSARVCPVKKPSTSTGQLSAVSRAATPRPSIPSRNSGFLACACLAVSPRARQAAENPNRAIKMIIVLRDGRSATPLTSHEKVHPASFST